MTRVLSTATAALFTLAGVAFAQQPPPIRQLGTVSAVSSEVFGDRVFTRHLRNGVLVNDVLNRRLVVLDQALANPVVVADSTPATASAYAGRSGSLIPYRGDSTLFVDASSLSMLVIDGTGKVTPRVMSVPRSQDAMVLGNPQLGVPGFDASGKLVYRSMPRPSFGGRGGAGGERREAGQQLRVEAGGAGGPMMMMPEIPDSAPVTRVDLATRAVDTIAFVKTPRPKMDVQRDDNGNVRMNITMNPLPIIDEWAVMSDGSVAIVRGRDYHVDFVRRDGKLESAPKMPFEWQRMTDEDKVAFLDSLKAARARLAANAPTPATPGAAGAAGSAVGGGGGGGQQMIVMGGGPGGPGGPGGAAGGPGRIEPNFGTPADLPDYKPAFFAGAVRADLDGRLWIRTIPTKGIAGGPVYDVVNTQGQLVDRVQIPVNRVIVGFGDGGVVYLLATDGTTRKLERATYK